MKVKTLMTKSVVTLKPYNTIKDAAILMGEHNIGGIPIVDEDNKPVGFVTDRDIVIRGVARHIDEKNNLEDIMSTTLFTVTPEDEIGNATHIMSHRQVRRLLVVDEDGTLSGILAMADISTQPETDTSAGIALSYISQISTDIESNPHHGVDVMDFPL